MPDHTPAQAAALQSLSTQHGRPYWPSLSVRPSGLMDATFIDGSGFVIEPSGEIRPA